MVLRRQSTMQFAFSRLVSVSVCLCVFSLLPNPQFSMVESGESHETERPYEEDGAEEAVVRSSARRRLNQLRHSELGTFHEIGDPHRIASYTIRCSAIVGHQLANDLCAPLLI